MLKNVAQLEDFHIIILILQLEIILYRETTSPIILLFRYMKALPKSEKLKAFIAPNMVDIITFPDNKVKYAVYT